MIDDVSYWYCIMQSDGGFWVVPDEPTSGKWAKFGTWNEAYAAGNRHRVECEKKLLVKAVAPTAKKVME